MSSNKTYLIVASLIILGLCVEKGNFLFVLVEEKKHLLMKPMKDHTLNLSERQKHIWLKLIADAVTKILFSFIINVYFDF